MGENNYISEVVISFFGAPYLIRFGRKDNDVWAYAEQTYQSASVMLQVLHQAHLILLGSGITSL